MTDDQVKPNLVIKLLKKKSLPLCSFEAKRGTSMG
jgi:hypothetical protein